MKLINNKYRETIGEAIEKSYKLEADETAMQMPTDEQIELWLADGRAKKSAKKARTMKRLSYAAVFAIVLSIGSGIMISPNVQASEISGAALTQGIDTLQIYEDINTLPKNIQEKFLILPNSIGEYNIDDVRLEQTSELTTLTYIYKDDRNNELLIEEDAGLDENLMKTIIGHYVGVERCGDIDIYIGEHIEESNTISYMFIYKDVYIKILASSDFSKNEIFELIEKAAGE